MHRITGRACNDWQRTGIEAIPRNTIILRDQFFEPVGEQGYYSAYDYVQNNVRNSVVWVENGLPFYAYDASFSNTVSRSNLPDYMVGFKTDWLRNGGENYPTLVEEYMADPAVQIVYQDPQGIVLYCP